MTADPLELAVRENATWCDLVCRLHRLAPEPDLRVWRCARRTPAWFPDAMTLDPAVGEVDVLGGIDDSAGASIKDSYATLDLEPQGYRARFDATWIARPPGVAARAEPRLAPVTDKLTFAHWRRAWGGPDDVLPRTLFRAPGVTVLGAPTPATFVAGVILHHTRIAGVEVVGASNAFGPLDDLVGAAAAAFPDAWIVGYERGDALDVARTHGFSALGLLRVWTRDG